MAWTTPSDPSTGQVITAGYWKTQIGDNLDETAPAKVTTAGDLIYASGANTLARLGIGASAKMLSVSGGLPAWVTEPAADLIAAAGDMLYGSAADTLAKLSIGAAYRVLSVNAGATAPEWTVAPRAIANSSLSVDTATPLTFSGLPAFDFYRIVIFVAGLSVSGSVQMRFNNDSGANYGAFQSNLNTFSAAGSGSGLTEMDIDSGTGTGARLIDLLISGVATVAKQVTGHSHFGNPGVFSGTWNNTADAISRIDLIASGGGNFLAGSRVLILGFNAS